MKKLGILILGLFLVTQLHASISNFDIYGVDDEAKKKIYSSCSKLIDEYIKISYKIHTGATPPDLKTSIRYKKIEEMVISRAKKIDNIARGKISVIYYPSDNKTYATLDLVKKNEAYRLPKSHKTSPKKLIKRSKGLNELFAVWEAYDDRNLALIRKNQIDLSKKSCPVIHCTWGFDKKELKETLPKLQSGTLKYKKELIEIIKYSSDNNEREKAIFILAHDSNYQELAKLLIEFTDDSSAVIRNNAMRVLGSIVSQHKIGSVDIDRIINALNYPYVTDRNKAAYVLLGLVKNEPASHPIVITKAGKTLLNLLKLQQPNNHDFAYLILKEISHKNYSEYDYKRWEQWLHTQQALS